MALVVVLPTSVMQILVSPGGLKEVALPSSRPRIGKPAPCCRIPNSNRWLPSLSSPLQVPAPTQGRERRPANSTAQSSRTFLNGLVISPFILLLVSFLNPGDFDRNSINPF